MPATEVVTSNEFFDYDAKYNGQVQEITPARLSADVAERVRQITSHIYDILHCNGIIRIDYIISKEGKISMLERPLGCRFPSPSERMCLCCFRLRESYSPLDVPEPRTA